MDMNFLLAKANMRLCLSQKQEAQFLRYYEILIEENNKYNLTAITQKDEVYTKHFLDSVVAERLLPKNAKIIDIGSGAGFPAIPLMIVRPDITATMIDSVNKKIGFIQYILKELDIKGEAIHMRAEDYKAGRGRFDAAVSRAVAKMPTLLEYCLPYLKNGGIFLAYKTEETEAENLSAALRELGADETIKIHNFSYLEYTRIILEIKKLYPTPARYPRSGNKPRLNPL